MRMICILCNLKKNLIKAAFRQAEALEGDGGIVDAFQAYLVRLDTQLKLITTIGFPVADKNQKALQTNLVNRFEGE